MTDMRRVTNPTLYDVLVDAIADERDIAMVEDARRRRRRSEWLPTPPWRESRRTRELPELVTQR